MRLQGGLAMANLLRTPILLLLVCAGPFAQAQFLPYFEFRFTDQPSLSKQSGSFFFNDLSKILFTEEAACDISKIIAKQVCLGALENFYEARVAY